MSKEDSETVLQEAQRLVYGTRQADYGHPYDAFSQVGQLWSAILGCDVTPQKAALCMVAIKISRELNKPKRDSRVDGAGYFGVLDLIEEEAARREGA